MPLTLCHPQAHNVVVLTEPMTQSTPCRPWARNTIVLHELVPFPSLQCYIVYFSMSFWAYKYWIWYATLPHCFDMLHCFCFVALLWYATHCYNCFDMLHIVILLLFYYILIFMNAYYIAQWWKWAKWDECGSIDQHYCTIKISVLNNTSHIGHSIKLNSESIERKFSSSCLPLFFMQGLFWW
jgi:hypothetical protein